MSEQVTCPLCGDPVGIIHVCGDPGATDIRPPQAVMSSALEYEFFPDRSGDAPSEWVRAQLARGCIVVQFYSADGNKVMRRSQMSFTRELVADAAPVLLGQVVVSEMRRHTDAGERDA